MKKLSKVGKKCPVCLSCFDMIWVGPRRVYHCWFCREFYDMIDNKPVVLDIEKETGISKDILEKQMDEYEKQKNR